MTHPEPARSAETVITDQDRTEGSPFRHPVTAAVMCLPAILLLTGIPLSCHASTSPDLPTYDELLFAELKREPSMGSSASGGRKKNRGSRTPALVPLPVDLPEDDSESEQDSEEAPPGERWKQYLGSEDSLSVGETSNGSLQNGRLMPWEGPGFVRKNDKAPYGTNETVAILLWAFEEMTRLYPGTVPAVVGDLSAERGGRLPPHASHRSGRDVDIGYYQIGNVQQKQFAGCPPEKLDADKTWTLLELLLATGQVEYFFIDRILQRPLYDEAAQRGWAEEDLQLMFEAPLGSRKRKGIIRHTPGHRHHVHVRFVCPEGDEDCR